MKPPPAAAAAVLAQPWKKCPECGSRKTRAAHSGPARLGGPTGVFRVQNRKCESCHTALKAAVPS